MVAFLCHGDAQRLCHALGHDDGKGTYIHSTILYVSAIKSRTLIQRVTGSRVYVLWVLSVGLFLRCIVERSSEFILCVHRKYPNSDVQH